MGRFSKIKVVSSAACAAAAVALLILPHAFGDEKTKKLDGKTLFEQKCLKCHKMAKFKEQQNNRKGWELILSRMQRGNCVLTDEEIDVLAEYLSQEFGE